MTVAIANNFIQFREVPTNFKFDNENKPELSKKNNALFVLPSNLPQNAFVEFNLTNFNQKFRLEVVNVNWSLNSSTISFYLKVFEGVFVSLILEGEWERQTEAKFHLKNVDLSLENKSEIPTSNFVAVSFWAMVGLSTECSVSIPSLDYNFNLSFNTPLNQISNLLQEREIGYRLMIIEKAFGISLSFPNEGIKGEDIEKISFCYHTIVNGEFNWLCKMITVFLPATAQFEGLLPETDIAFFFNFPTPNEQREIFGHQINLGQFIIVIDEAIVANYDEAKEGLLKLNGCPVEIIIKPISGVVKYISLNEPLSKEGLFNKYIQKLIDFEPRLVDALFEKHLNSFSNAFEELSDEQIDVLTERPILEEEAFNF